mmetsp:Transcript_103007/g.169509  ORF Transcript_103007/g.169509 Transcript_103007/m.169509 type:complete len:180 (-) Transcript_103007:59-598(-)
MAKRVKKVAVMKKPSASSVLRKPAIAKDSLEQSPSYVAVLFFFNDAGSLEYESLGSHAQAEDAAARVKQALTRWKEIDALRLCVQELRNIESENRAAEIKQLVQSCVRSKSSVENGLLMIDASIDGLGVDGSSHYWRWQVLESGADLPQKAKAFYRDLINQGVLQGCPIRAPEPSLRLS